MYKGLSIDWEIIALFDFKEFELAKMYFTAVGLARYRNTMLKSKHSANWRIILLDLIIINFEVLMNPYISKNKLNKFWAYIWAVQIMTFSIPLFKRVSTNLRWSITGFEIQQYFEVLFLYKSMTVTLSTGLFEHMF